MSGVGKDEDGIIVLEDVLSDFEDASLLTSSSMHETWARNPARYLFNHERIHNESELRDSQVKYGGDSLFSPFSIGSRAYLPITPELMAKERLLSVSQQLCDHVASKLMQACNFSVPYVSRHASLIQSQGLLVQQQREHTDLPPGLWDHDSPHPWLSGIIAVPDSFSLYLRPGSQKRDAVRRIALHSNPLEATERDTVLENQYCSAPFYVQEGEAIIFRTDLVHCGNAFVALSEREDSSSMRIFSFFIPEGSELSIESANETHFVQLKYENDFYSAPNV